MKEPKEFLGFSRSMLLHCILLYIGIWGGLLINSYIFVAVAGFTVLVSIFSKMDTTYYHLFFLLPFSVIFKLSPDSTSLFAYLIIATGAILLLRKRYVHGVVLALLLIFIAYAMLGMGNNYTTVAKMAFGLVLLYVFVSSVSPDHFKNHIVSFGLGTLGSSLIGTMKVSWDRLMVYFSDIDYIYINGERSFRFTGLNYDPNYYAMGVIIAIFLCLRLYFNKDGNRLFIAAITIPTILFGFLSYSKMYLLSILILFAFFVLYRMKSIEQSLLTIMDVSIIVMVFAFWADSSGYITTISERLTGDDISTGRFVIWGSYLDYIWNSPATLFLGDGLGAPYDLPMGPHNAYIELIFFLGIFGGALFILTVIYIMDSTRHVERRVFINRVLIILFLIMIGTLGIVTVNDLMFYCMLLWISMNMGEERMACIT